MLRNASACGLSVLLIGAGAAHAINFKDGRWHVLVTTEIRGARMSTPKPLLYEQCFTKDSIEPHLTSPNAPCRAVELKKSEREMTWRLQCVEETGGVKGEGRIRFMGDRIDGAVVTRLQHPDRVQVVQRVQGRRVGVCDMPGEPLQKRMPSPLPQYRGNDVSS